MKTTIALGMFDGVHIGHSELINKVVSLANENGSIPMVYTFTNHPLSVIIGSTPPVLSTIDEKRAILLKMGIETVVADDFDKELCEMSPENFAKMLKDRFNCVHAVAGFNYSFGYGGHGNVDKLREYGKELGYDVTKISAVNYKDKAVSSNRIRRCVEAGEIEDASFMLGRPFYIRGRVVENKHNGGKLGFPTANIGNEYNRPVPRFGVYATRVHLRDETYCSITNVGDNPTFNGDKLSIETNIFNFGSNIYGEEIILEFKSFIRPQRRFESAEELSKQVMSDIETVKRIHFAG